MKMITKITKITKIIMKIMITEAMMTKGPIDRKLVQKSKPKLNRMNG